MRKCPNEKERNLYLKEDDKKLILVHLFGE